MTFYIFNSNVNDVELPLCWQGRIDIYPQRTDKEYYIKYFDSRLIKHKKYNKLMKKDMSISSFYLNNKMKCNIKNFILNGKSFSFSWDCPEWVVEIQCNLDGAEIEFNNLDKESKEKILDSILFQNVADGNFEIPAEITNDEEEDEENGYIARVHPPYYVEFPAEPPMSENLQIMEKYCYNTVGSIRSKKRISGNNVA